MKEITIRNINNCDFYAKHAQEYFTQAIKNAQGDRDDLLNSIKRCYETLLNVKQSNDSCNHEVFGFNYALDIFEIWLGRFYEVKEVPDTPEEEDAKPVEE